MPRRLRLVFGGAGQCGITGLDVEEVAIGFRTRNYGIEYDSWLHPLAPYYQSKKQSEWLPVHPQPDGVGWKDWHSLTVDSAEQGSRPAQVVGHFKNLRARGVSCRAPRMRAFGVDFDNMKCRSWVEAGIPLFIAETEAAQALLQDVGRRLTRATEIAAAALRFAVKRSLFATPGDASGDFAQVSAELWAATESTFYAALGHLAKGASDSEAAHRETMAFQRVLATATLEVFDRWCPVDSVAPVALRRAVSERYRLTGTLSGHGMQGSKLFGEMQIPLPMGGVRKSRASRKKGGASA